jgi:hypothetical protein
MERRGLRIIIWWPQVGELFAVPGAPRRSSAVRQAADSEPGHVLMWFGAMGSSLLVSYVFYLLIERPSHRLARKVRLSKATAVPRYEDQEIRAVVAPEI